MSKRNAALLLEDILSSARKIITYTQGLSFEAFIADEKTIDAVIRNFEIIGEAANPTRPRLQTYRAVTSVVKNCWRQLDITALSARYC